MIPSLPIQQKGNLKQDRFIFPMGNRIINVDHTGAVYASDFSQDNRLGERYRLWGPPVAFNEGNGIKSKAVLPLVNPS